uniref:Uncharacterized protein K02A2.6 n=1 Tax=Cacopsylla melanoneura TaxID=428564 RepID=A0A8D8RNC4_9HEMI
MENQAQQPLASTMAHDISAPPAYEYNIRTGVEDWTIFKLQLENFMKLTGLEGKGDDVKKAYLISLLGKEMMKVYVNMNIRGKTNQETMKALDDYILPQRNVIYERYVFGITQQQKTERFDQYYSNLRHLASTCEFGTMHDELLRDRIVLGVISNVLRKRYLGDPGLTLAKALELGKAFEATEIQCNVLNDNRHKMTSDEHEQIPDSNVFKFSNSSQSCWYCGNNHARKKELCPALGKICTNCGRPNHFARVCKQKTNNNQFLNITNGRDYNKYKKTNQVSEQENETRNQSEEEDLWQVSKRAEMKKEFVTKLNFLTENDIKELKCQLDTGAACNVLNYEDYRILCGLCGDEKLERSRMQLRCYGGEILKPRGKKTLTVIHEGKMYDLEFQVVDTRQTPLISVETCVMMNLVTVNANLCKINAEISLTQDKIVEEFQDVFKGLGRLEGKYDIEIEDKIVPVKKIPRRVPIALKDKLKQKLNELEAKGVIQKETEPTEWISNLVMVNKNDKLRLCLDPKDLNKAIKRSHFQIPTLDEMTPQLF